MKGGDAPRLGFKGDVPMAIRSDLERYATLSSPSVSPDRLLSDHAWAVIVDHIVLRALSEYFDNSLRFPPRYIPEEAPRSQPHTAAVETDDGCGDRSG
jgi:hypothetical protein